MKRPLCIFLLVLLCMALSISDVRSQGAMDLQTDTAEPDPYPYSMFGAFGLGYMCGQRAEIGFTKGRVQGISLTITDRDSWSNVPRQLKFGFLIKASELNSSAFIHPTLSVSFGSTIRIARGNDFYIGVDFGLQLPLTRFFVLRGSVGAMLVKNNIKGGGMFNAEDDEIAKFHFVENVSLTLEFHPFHFGIVQESGE